MEEDNFDQGRNAHKFLYVFIENIRVLETCLDELLHKLLLRNKNKKESSN